MNVFEVIKSYIYLVVFWACFLILLGFIGCTQMPQVSAPVKPQKEVTSSTKTVLAWGDKKQNWTDSLLKELSGKAFLSVTPKDFSDWCPQFPVMSLSDRAEFYAQLVSIMAKRESGFNPASKYTEAFNDSKGRPVISRGLLQISIESSNSYGCNFKDAEELHDPIKNLACAVKIIERWVTRDQRLGGKVADKWQGCARYWSVCRSVSRSYSLVSDYVKKQKMCLQ
jgi:Transglycosylase SLT domain